MIVGVILAGGLARRMGGGDKALIEVAGRPLLAHAISRLTPQVSAVAINANGDPERFADFELPVLPDASEDRLGPLEGVLAGLAWARDSGATHLVSVAADTPFFPESLVERLASAADPLACAETSGRTHPVFGLWPVALEADLRRAVYEDDIRKVDRWTAGHGCAAVAFDGMPFDPFFNVNRPDDLAEAERIAMMIA